MSSEVEGWLGDVVEFLAAIVLLCTFVALISFCSGCAGVDPPMVGRSDFGRERAVDRLYEKAELAGCDAIAIDGTYGDGRGHWVALGHCNVWHEVSY